MTTKVERNCQSCNHHSSGIALKEEDSGRIWYWQDCTKSWGKPTPVGVIKNMCNLYMPKKEAK